MKQAGYILIVVAVIIVFVMIRKKSARALLLAAVNERFGHIQNINEKTDAELKEILKSGGAK